MYGPAGKVAGGAAATLPVTGFTSGTGILFMVVLATVLIALPDADPYTDGHADADPHTDIRGDADSRAVLPRNRHAI